MSKICPQLKQNLETISSLKSELDLELEKVKKTFKDLKTGNPSTSLRAERKDLMNKIKSLKTEINSNIKTTENLIPGKIISAISPEGKEIRFELKEQLEYWNDFYKDEKVDWITLPENIKITKEQQKEMERLITEFGFDKMIIIPENLAATGADYEKLHTLMSKGYNETHQSDGFKADGGFAGLKNKSDKLRIILTKDVKELSDDNLFKQTLYETINALEGANGILTKNKLKDLDVATYLVYQKEYFRRTGKHLDVVYYTVFLEQVRSAIISIGTWDHISARLRFGARIPDRSGSVSGCRLAGIFEIE
jgi:hypothetical protein